MSKTDLAILRHPKAFLAYWLIGLMFVSFNLNADEIIVGGTLSEDQVWTEDNTYIVNQDLRIGQNILLTILPGVTVRINQGRGIHLDGGDLIVGDMLGVNTDSVRFLGNYRQAREGWKWKGIMIENVGDENTIFFSHASIHDAEIALDLKNSSYVLVKNSSIMKSQNIGIRMTDCSRCIIQDCFIYKNWNGIEMVATSSNELLKNNITNNRILNLNHNIYMHVENNGSFRENVLSRNHIEAANNGIWMDAVAEGSSMGNVISKNVFVNNGSGFGFGLILAFDSTHIKNNIFWLNNIALIFDPIGQNSDSRFNSFFQNINGILVGSGSSGNDLSHNTFSRQVQTDFDTKETAGINFTTNNFFPAVFDFPLIYNSTRNDLSIQNNYWNTTQTPSIDQLIWDQKDDPNLGLLYYDPIVDRPDTNLPISPPTRVAKQWVNGKVRITWNENAEADVMGYRVYFENFEYYQFDSVSDIGFNRHILLNNRSITDSIAVTAYDFNGNDPDAQLEGHESPYSFADYYPYAGENQQFCIDQSEFALNQSTAPFSYTTLSWKTDGDGIFSNSAIVNPRYFPGEQDLLNGSVSLSIHVLRNGRWFSDAVELTFVDLAEVMAGADSTIFVDEQLALSSAEEHFVNELRWSTSGDGLFSSDTVLNPLYEPGEMDKLTGKADLILIGRNVCGVSRDTLHLSIVQRYTINGAVWNGDQPSDFSAVVAIKTGSTPDRAMAFVNADFTGKFVFNTLYPGNYLLYAVPDTVGQKEYFPGYYANVDRWHNAYALPLEADIYDVDIYLPLLEHVLPEGKGEISGHFALPHFAFKHANIYCQSWFDENLSNDFCKSGVSNITILLYNSTHEKVLDYTVTDINGNFFFRNLPMGKYIVDAEIAGFLTNPSTIITLDPQQPRIDHVEIGIMQKNIFIQVHDNPNNNQNHVVEVYPNPAETEITVKVTGYIKGDYRILIFDVYGRKVEQTGRIVNNGYFQQTYFFDVSKFASGFYFGLVEGNHTKQGFSFIVR